MAIVIYTFHYGCGSFKCIICKLSVACLLDAKRVRLMPQRFTNAKSTLFQAMPLHLTQPSHYLSPCWHNSMSPLASLGHSEFLSQNYHWSTRDPNKMSAHLTKRTRYFFHIANRSSRSHSVLFMLRHLAYIHYDDITIYICLSRNISSCVFHLTNLLLCWF